MADLTREAIEQTPDVTPEDVRDEEALLQELAALSPLAYDRRRESAAKLLGVRVGTLDAEMAARRPRQTEPEGGGTPLLFSDPEPWPETVNGAGLLDDLSTFYSRYVVLPEGAADMLAVWTLHTYTQAAAQITPRLGIESPQKRCGKTTLLALIGAVVARPLPASNITPAALFRAIEQWRPTMLIDEADTFLPDNDELRGVLNAGHTRSQAYVIRTVGDEHEPRAFGVWAPVAIALIGKLPSTLADRALVIKMRRKLASEPVERLRLDRLKDTEALQRRCVRWAHDALADLYTRDPVMPEGLNDRAADNWRPLCAIAEVASGQWSHRLTKAIKALTPPEHDDEAAGVMLLEDCGTCSLRGPQRSCLLRRFWRLCISSRNVRGRSGDVTKSRSRPGKWRGSSPVGIKSQTIRIGADVSKGYEQDDFLDAWSRYLPHPLVTQLHVSNGAGLEAVPVTKASPPLVTQLHVRTARGWRRISSVTSSNGADVTEGVEQNAASQAECNPVTNDYDDRVTGDTASKPASHNGCNHVTDRSSVFTGASMKLSPVQSVERWTAGTIRDPALCGLLAASPKGVPHE